MMLNSVNVAVLSTVPVLYCLDQSLIVALLLVGLLLYQVCLPSIPRGRGTPLTYNPQRPIHLRASVLQGDLL